MVVSCYIIIYAMLCYSYFIHSSLQLMPSRGWKSCGALLSLRPMYLRCSWRQVVGPVVWLFIIEFCIWMPIMAMIPMIRIMTTVILVKSCEILWTWFGLDAFSAFPALFSVLHVYPRRHACWDLRASWLPLAALATAWSQGCVKYFADLRSFIWIQTQTMQQFAVIGTLKPKAMVPQDVKWCQSAT